MPEGALLRVCAWVAYRGGYYNTVKFILGIGVVVVVVGVVVVVVVGVVVVVVVGVVVVVVVGVVVVVVVGVVVVVVVGVVVVVVVGVVVVVVVLVVVVVVEVVGRTGGYFGANITIHAQNKHNKTNVHQSPNMCTCLYI